MSTAKTPLAEPLEVPALRTDRQIKADVAAGLRLHAICEAAKEEMNEIASRLKADALNRPDEHRSLHEADREGRQWTAPGGLIIIISGDSLMSDMEEGSKHHHAALDAIFADLKNKVHDTNTPEAWEMWTANFAALTTPWIGYLRTERDGLAYRRAVRELLAEPHSEGFIAAWKSRDASGTPKNTVSAEWEALAKDKAMETAKKEFAKIEKAIVKAEKKEGK